VPPSVRDEATQRVACNEDIQCPIEGIRHPQTSYLSLEWEVSIAPLQVSWNLAIRIFCVGYLRKMHGTTRSRFDREGGGISLCLILWRGTCPVGSHPSKSGLGYTQILTRHLDVQSQTVSQLIELEDYTF
jgi:hypothetical protein